VLNSEVLKALLKTLRRCKWEFFCTSLE